MTTQSPITVLVLAVGGNVSQGILKALDKSALPCRVIGADVSAMQTGLYTVDAGYICPWAHEPGFVDWLIDVCRKENVAIILTGCEPVIAVLAQHRRHIESAANTICLVNDVEIADTCDDKLRTCHWLKAQGLSYPDYADSTDPDAVRQLAAQHGFPLFAKHRVGGGAQGVMLLRDDDDISYITRRSNYIVQEYLGSDDREYTVGCFCDRNGSLLGSIVLWRELLQGTTYRAVAGAYPEIKAEAERIVRALKPKGPCNVQLRMTDRGPVCFEINARFSGAAPIRAQLGFNEVEAALRHFVLGEPAPPLPQVKSGVALRYWNEIYPQPDAVAQLESTGRIDNRRGRRAHVDEYGKQSQ